MLKKIFNVVKKARSGFEKVEKVPKVIYDLAPHIKPGQALKNIKKDGFLEGVDKTIRDAASQHPVGIIAHDEGRQKGKQEGYEKASQAYEKMFADLGQEMGEVIEAARRDKEAFEKHRDRYKQIIAELLEKLTVKQHDE